MLEASLQPYARGAIVAYTAPLDRKECIDIGFPSSHPVLILDSNYSTPKSTVQCFLLSSKLDSYYGYRIFINSKSHKYGGKWSVICCREMYTIRKNCLGEIIGFATPALVDKCVQGYLFEIGASTEIPDYIRRDRMAYDYYNAGAGNSPARPVQFRMDREFNEDKVYGVGIAAHDRPYDVQQDISDPPVSVQSPHLVTQHFDVKLNDRFAGPAYEQQLWMYRQLMHGQAMMETTVEPEQVENLVGDGEEDDDHGGTEQSTETGRLDEPTAESGTDESGADGESAAGHDGADATGAGTGGVGTNEGRVEPELEGGAPAGGTDLVGTDGAGPVQPRDLRPRSSRRSGGYVAPRTNLEWSERKARVETRQVTAMRNSKEFDKCMTVVGDDVMWHVFMDDIQPAALAKLAGISQNRGRRLAEYICNHISRCKSKIVTDLANHTVDLNSICENMGDRLIFRCFEPEDCKAFQMGLPRYEDYAFDYGIGFENTYIGQLVINGVIRNTVTPKLGWSLVKDDGE